MDFTLIGKKIKELRKVLGLSQGELANGICTQAQISKIENGDVYPYASTLYLISQRLGVDVNYFFDIGLTPRLDYVQEVSKQLNNARKNMKYNEMKEIVDMEQTNPLFFQNKRNYQVLLWHKGIYEHAIHRNAVKAVEILQEAISLTQTTEKFYSERELEIVLSIGVIYTEEHDLRDALTTFENGLKYIWQIPYLNDTSIPTRFFYNIARVLTRLKSYEESDRYCIEGIGWCVKQESMYLLGELYYHRGYNHELKNNYSTALQLLEKAKFIFNLQQDERFANLINEKIEKLRTCLSLPE
ncbi:helix-turn-helix domain-containing protein [Cytobacillus sp. FJAT-54145]|uniref:Helix-turn-helix domain-containing protein n=1 Tax=Cytobacillus spartinae TaxID=3299023 RepID=A0ABW6KFR7_9BACI